MTVLVDAIGSHTVYSQIHNVMSNVSNHFGFTYRPISPSYDNSRIITLSSTNYVFYIRNLDLKRTGIYAANSPLLNINAWEALVKNSPMVLIEEYFARGNYRDLIAKSMLLPFNGYPFICLTKKTAAFLNHIGIKYFLIPPTEEKRQALKRRKHILFVGRAEPSKNPFFFLNLAKRFRDEHFVFIGRGSLSEQIAMKAKECGNIEYAPFVESKEEFFDYYRNAKLFIHPALRDPIGQVIIEALSTSTPVLASSNTGASSFLPSDWIMKTFDEEVWIDRIKHILANQEDSIAQAGLVFEKEHLNSSDPYS